MSTLPPQSPTSPLPKRQKTSPSKTTTETTPLATTSTSNSLQEIMSSAPSATAPAAAPAAAQSAAPTTETAAPAPVASAQTSNGTTNTTARKSSNPPPLLIKKLSPRARLPTRGSAFAAGYDIYAAKETVVPAKGKVLVDTDISMAVPDGTCMFLCLISLPFFNPSSNQSLPLLRPLVFEPLLSQWQVINLHALLRWSYRSTFRTCF